MAVIIRLDFDGIFDSGFHASLFWQEASKQASARDVGFLPPCPELLKAYQNWQRLYGQLELPQRLKAKPGVTNVSFLELHHQGTEAQAAFVSQLNEWLRDPAFQPIRDVLLQGFNAQSDHQVFIQSGNKPLLRLPWQSWELFETQQHLEISVGPLKAIAPRQKRATPSSKVRVLAILGQDDGIDLSTDLKALKQLPGTELTFLIQPTRQDIHHKLWDQPWDILFFSGHSETQGEQGVIHLSADQSLAIADLKHGLQSAISQGLKLAIFNSCDGLGLAWELQELQIPQSIVMREQVPDPVAHQFLKSFLTHFSRGKTLFESTRIAREQLEGLEAQYPFASWLPTLVSNSTMPPPTWKKLRYGNHTQRHYRLLKATLVGSIVMTGLLSLGRWSGVFQSIELTSYDFLSTQRLAHHPEEMDPRLIIIGVSNRDIGQMRQAGLAIHKQTIPDTVLATALKTLLKYNPQVIGYDFWREQAVSSDHPQLKQVLEDTPQIIGVCHNFGADVGIPPPPELPTSRTGFSNLPQDSDKVIRRYLYGMGASQLCPTDTSFGLLLAMKYLESQGVFPDDSFPLKFGEVIIPDIHASTGGYALSPKERGGYQTLIHFRAASTLAPVFSLQQLLNDEIPHEAIAGKIVLIGNLSVEGKDFHRTPIHLALSGVEVHGHMVSQLLSAVLDDRPLLRSWSNLGETVWLLAWGLIGGSMASVLRRPSTILLSASMTFMGIALLCYLALLMGLWLVWIPAFLSWLISFGGVGVHRLRLEEPS